MLDGLKVVAYKILDHVKNKGIFYVAFLFGFIGAWCVNTLDPVYKWTINLLVAFVILVYIIKRIADWSYARDAINGKFDFEHVKDDENKS